MVAAYTAQIKYDRVTEQEDMLKTDTLCASPEIIQDAQTNAVKIFLNIF